MAIATGWILFGFCLVGSLIFSWCYILYLRSLRHEEKSTWTNFISVLCLTITIVSAGLVPVDVFLVSSMKTSNGTYEEWAKDPQTRSALMWHVQLAYYALFSLILVLAFLVLPSTFFYFTASTLDEDEEGEAGEEVEAQSTGKRLCRALKFTSASVLLLLVLIILGIFLPFEGTAHLTGELKDKLLEEWYIMEDNKGFDLILFLMNSVSVVGMFLLVIYTGCGLSSWPCQLLSGSSSGVNFNLSLLLNQIVASEGRLEELQQHEDDLNAFEREEVGRLQEELRILNRSKQELEEASRTCINRLLKMLRPFQVLFGIFGVLLLILITTSLTLTNVDKALHSTAKAGYVLRNGTLPNPMDIALVLSQRAFPLDYILYLGLVIFFVVTSINGVVRIGIRFLWLPLWRIKPHGTKPQALALMSLILILILIALNVLLYALTPNYTTYGSQKFQIILPTNRTEILNCDDSHAPANECNMTRVAFLLLAFHTKAWIFGAFYYWLTWVFIIILLIGSVYSLVQCKQRRGQMPAFIHHDDQDGLLSDD